MSPKEPIGVDVWPVEPENSNTLVPALHHSTDFKSSAQNVSLSADETADRRSCLHALLGLGFAIIFGLLCLIGGIVVATYKSFDYEVVGIAPVVRDTKYREIFTVLLRFVFTQLNTFATEAIGYMHSVTHRSTLAARSSGRSSTIDTHSITRDPTPQFHTNLRFFTCSSGPHIPLFHPNGLFCNLLMALLLILSYAAVSHTILEVSTTGESDDDSVFVAVLGVPLIVLGVCIILKCFIVLVGFKRTTILTWSSSPLSNTFAAITAGQVARREGLCMYNILDVIRVENSPGTSFPPKKPSAIQPSAWRTRRGIRRTVIALWVLVVACGVWGGIIVAVWGNTSLKEVTPGLESWSIVPNSRSNAVEIPLVFNSALNWFTCFCVLVVVQGPLTLALHCCELIVNVLRDEAIWRKATTKGGTKSSDVLRSFGSFWPSIALLMGKAVLQWLFGFCLSLEGSLILGAGCELASNDATNPCGNIVALPIVMRSIQIWYLTIALGLFSTVMTFLATYQPRGPQPAAYGHTQTLANLIDDWSPSMTMWWGHKDGGGYEKDGEYIFHAGTNSSPLPGVKLDGLYA